MVQTAPAPAHSPLNLAFAARAKKPHRKQPGTVLYFHYLTVRQETNTIRLWHFSRTPYDLAGTFNLSNFGNTNDPFWR